MTFFFTRDIRLSNGNGHSSSVPNIRRRVATSPRSERRGITAVRTCRQEKPQLLPAALTRLDTVRILRFRQVTVSSTISTLLHHVFVGCCWSGVATSIILSDEANIFLKAHSIHHMPCALHHIPHPIDHTTQGLFSIQHHAPYAIRIFILIHHTS